MNEGGEPTPQRDTEEDEDTEEQTDPKETEERAKADEDEEEQTDPKEADEQTNMAENIKSTSPPSAVDGDMTKVLITNMEELALTPEHITNLEKLSKKRIPKRFVRVYRIEETNTILVNPSTSVLKQLVETGVITSVYTDNGRDDWK